MTVGPVSYTHLGGLFITVLSFIMILTVYSRMFKLYMYTALAPIPLSSFAGEPTSNVGKNFLRSYAGVCLEGLHLFGIGHEVGRDITAVELHALDHLHVGLGALGLLDGDDALRCV